MKTNKNKHKAYLIYSDLVKSRCCLNVFDNECSLLACLRNNGMHLKAKQRIALQRGRKVFAYDFMFVMEFLD